MTEQRTIAEGLFEWPSDEPRVQASRCDTCSFVTFPAQGACPSCGGDAVTPTLLLAPGHALDVDPATLPAQEPALSRSGTGERVRPLRRGLH